MGAMTAARVLAVVETHPVQYHAPVYRKIQQLFGIPVHVVYGSDFSVAGYRDAEFEQIFAWDVDLLEGYGSEFLSRIASGGPQSADKVSARALPGALARINPAAVLLLGYSPRFYRHAVWHAWRSRYRILFRGETTDHAISRGPLKQRLRDGFLRRFYRRCSRLLYVGMQSREHYQRLGVPDERLVFSPYCVETGAFAPDEADRDRLRAPTRHEFRLADDDLVILFSGKLVNRKSPATILEAVRLLGSHGGGRIVVLYLGDGSLRPRLVELAEADPLVPVRFLGFQNQRALSRFYHAADLLVLPSISGETWGLAVNEALCHGVPCVASDRIGCAPDLIEPGVTGEVFPAGQAAMLADALLRARSLVGRLQVREACRRKVADYSVGRAAEGVAKAFWAAEEMVA